MIDVINSISLLIGINSLFAIILVLNQNDSTKDSITNRTPSSSNPFEKLTWFSLIAQLSLLLIKIKSNDF